jgi:O-antigen/teichoic acid export membrane protein
VTEQAERAVPEARPGPLSHRRRQLVVRLAGRAGWSIVDQALSSLSNLLLSILVARAVDAEDFGAFTISFAVYSVVVLLARALLGQPLGIRYADADERGSRVAAGSSTGAAAVVGIVLAGLVCGVAWLIGGHLGVVLAVMAAFLPGLLVQDVWRLAFFAQGRPQLAALIDALWSALLAVGVVLLVLARVHHAAPYVLAWGAAATLAAVVGGLRGRAAPQVADAWTWVRSHWTMTRFLLFEQMLTQGAYQGSLMLIGGVGSLSAVASLRGAQVALGPVAALSVSAMAFAVPELARRSWLTAAQRLRIALVSGTALAVLGVLWGVVVLLLPASIGEEFLGDSWSGVRTVLLASLVGQVASLFTSGASYVVYSRGATAAAFVVNATVAVLLVVLGLTGLVLGGAVGAAWGFTVAFVAVVPLWFRALARLGPAQA